MSALGLSRASRYAARSRAKRAALLGYRHRGAMHYTQGWRRWDGIRLGLRGDRGHFPNYEDCSAFYSWCLWCATRHNGLGDFVNGAFWRAGFTGTMTRHGVQVPLNKLLVADAIMYGGSYSVPEHTAIYVGHGKVVSFGSEIGPLLLPYNYRPINHARRYIR